MIGVLFNCCEPEAISKALKEIKADQHIQQYLQHPLSETSASTQLLDEKLPLILLGAYANRLTPVDPKWILEGSEEAQPMRYDLSPKQYAEFVKRWHSDCGKYGHHTCGSKGDDSHTSTITDEIGGLQLIGGCCGIGPEHISALNKQLGHQTKKSNVCS